MQVSHALKGVSKEQVEFIRRGTEALFKLEQLV